MRRTSVAVVSVVSALALSACYGATEPATDVGEDTAVLHARGTADRGAATSYFEFWADGDPLPGGARPRTAVRSWPAGASGPITERVADLLVASTYSFRLCGGDQGRQAVCAQTRVFTTRTPPGDYVKGSFGGLDPFISSPYTVRFNARSGPSGENARGTVRFSFAGQSRAETVTCLKVNDIFATIGAVRDDGSSILYAVRDTREEAAGWGTAGTTNPPDCNGGNFEGWAHNQQSFVIHDAP